MSNAIRNYVAALAVLVTAAFASSATANTIQARLVLGGVTNNGDGTFTWSYSVRVTDGNGLSKDTADAGAYQSGLILVDFQGLVQPDVRNKLTASGTDVTTTADWVLDLTTFAGSGAGLQNVTYDGVQTTIKSPTLDASANDSASIRNVVLAYQGSGVAIDSNNPQNLIHLDLISTYGVIGNQKELSRDTTTTSFASETYLNSGPVAPLPAPAIAGAMILLGFGGMKARKGKLA